MVTIAVRTIITFLIIMFVLMNLIRNSVLKKYKPVNYEDIQHTLKTGDILLFGYSEPRIASYLTKIATLSPWSHVGLVCRVNDRLYVCEFTSKKEKAIANFQPLRKVLNEYDGTIAVIAVEKKIPYHIINKHFVSYRRKRFAPWYVGLLYIITHLLNIKMIDDRPYGHCSMFVSKVFQDAGLINCNDCFFVTPASYDRNDYKIKYSSHYLLKKRWFLF